MLIGPRAMIRFVFYLTIGVADASFKLLSSHS